jgi:hypothetical protein
MDPGSAEGYFSSNLESIRKTLSALLEFEEVVGHLI